MTKKGDFCAACGRDAEQEKDGSWAQYHFADCPHHPTRQALASRGVNPVPDINELPVEDKSTHSADASRYVSAEGGEGYFTQTHGVLLKTSTKLSGLTVKLPIDTLQEILENYYATQIKSVKLTKQQVIIDFRDKWEND